MDEKLQVKATTIARTLVLILALVNQILVTTGHSVLPFTDEEVEMFVTTAFTACASLWAWWKNNSFTIEAKQADEYLQELKNGGQ